MTASLFVFIMLSLFLLFCITVIGLTYSASSWITRTRLSAWWKLYSAAILQVILTAGLFSILSLIINSEDSVTRQRITFYIPFIACLTLVLTGAVFLKILTASRWPLVLKVWGVATGLQIIVTPLIWFILPYFLGTLEDLIYPSSI
jgi:hypothetical protein